MEGLLPTLREIIAAFGPVSGSMLIVTLFMFYMYRQREKQYDQEVAQDREQVRGDQARMLDVLSENARSHEALAQSITHLTNVTRETAISTQRQLEGVARALERTQR